MKKTMRIIATAALSAASGTALAQGSNVTLAGVADAAGRYVSNEGRGSVKSLVSGSNSTSKLIIRGSEDLGDGLSAGFHLEHGLQLDSGTQVVATQFWDRRATVMLASKSLGEIRAGRDYDPKKPPEVVPGAPGPIAVPPPLRAASSIESVEKRSGRVP